MVLFCPPRVRSSESMDGGRHTLEAVLSVAGEGERQGQGREYCGGLCEDTSTETLVGWAEWEE